MFALLSYPVNCCNAKSINLKMSNFSRYFGNRTVDIVNIRRLQPSASYSRCCGENAVVWKQQSDRF